MKKSILNFSVFTAGFTTIVTQVLIMRELVVIFYGNELSLGIMLGIWLFWTAIGSGLIPRILPDTQSPHIRVALLQATLSLILPLLLFFIRIIKEMIGVTLGEMIGFVPMFIITFITLSPICLIFGLLYTTSCHAFGSFIKKGSESIGRVYLLEAIGSTIGGVFASFIFLRYTNPAFSFFLLCILNLTSAILLSSSFLLRISKTAKVLLFVFLIVYTASGFIFSEKLQNIYDKMLWKGYDLVATKTTIYGNIVVTRIGEQFNFFENGLLIFSAPDKLTAEESVQFALLEHPEPKRVLLIGGVSAGSIDEILTHPSVERVDYVQLDPELVRLSRKILPSEYTKSFDDPRVEIHYDDGLRYIKNSHEKYDVVLLNFPNPFTAQLNRFYTVEFFREVIKRLNKGGIFSFNVSSSENAISPELSDFLSTIYSTTVAVFPEVILLPGETVRFIASSEVGLLTSDPQVLIERLKKRELKTKYVREYYLPYQLSKERQNFLKSRIYIVEPDKINRDFKPIGYYFDTILWATYFSTGFKKIFLGFSRLSTINICEIFAFITMLIIIINLFKNRKERSPAIGIIFSILIVGFTEISLEVILILGFQVIHGYVYQHLSILVAAYMLGLALGSRITISEENISKNSFSIFRLLQLSMAIYPLITYGILLILHGSTSTRLISNVSVWIFPFVVGGAGFIGGCQFPLANHLYLRKSSLKKGSAGLLYGIDLTGSSAGALLTSGFIIPILGIPNTLLLLSFINICALIVLLISKMPAQIKD